MTAAPPRYLAVVRRGETDVYRLLKQYLEARGIAHVVWDRRTEERRRASDAGRPDRRRGERRGPARGAGGHALGFFIARRPEPEASVATKPARRREAPSP
ncbi:MAG TPA: hypothetical protein VGW35_17175 [Methylomirabilota bacterium]|jgi:hypothetical protein|nr:hypothetical protein [Methylomirabilota bacterium]